MDMDSTEASELDGIPDTQESPAPNKDGWDKSANLFTRLVRAQADANQIKKDNQAKISSKKTGKSFTYNYVSHDDIAHEARRILTKHGVLFFSTTEDINQTNNRTEIKIKSLFINADNDKEQLESIGYGYSIDDQDKGPGKAYSYAIKYILAKTLLLNTSDDIEQHDIDYNPAATSEAALKTRVKTENDIKEWVNSFSRLIDDASTYDQLKKLKTDNAEMFKAKVVPDNTKEALAKKLHDKMELAREAIAQEVPEDA
jgi:hypothetical protein